MRCVIVVGIRVGVRLIDGLTRGHLYNVKLEIGFKTFFTTRRHSFSDQLALFAQHLTLQVLDDLFADRVTARFNVAKFENERIF